jgi:RNA polymerase sigma factor (sigma-70 family)
MTNDGNTIATVPLAGHVDLDASADKAGHSTSCDREDQATIREVLAGNTNAFGRLVARHERRLHATLLQVLANPSEAEDALQEAFVRAYAKLSSFRGDSSFATWITRIAINLGRNYGARRSASSTTPLDDAPQAMESSDQRSPLEDLLANEDRERVHKALDEVSANHRMVLVLRDFQDYSYKEISRILNCPIGTVMSRLSHARKALADRLVIHDKRHGGIL